MDVGFFSALASIVLINLVLSGDNAVVIAMATLRLESKQRKLAIFWGTFGAVALRIVLTAVAALLLTIPYIQAVGGLLLTWISVKLLQGDEEHDDKEAPESMAGAIKTIVVADFLMSLDNVLAVAGASGGNLLLLVLGLLLSIPLVIWGSTLISSLMRRWSWLIYVGAGLIGWTAGEMLLKEPYFKALSGYHWLQYAIPVGLTAIVLLIGHRRKRRHGEVLRVEEDKAKSASM